MINQANLLLYKDQGYLLIPDFASSDECRALQGHAAALVAAFNPTTDPRCQWNASLPVNHVSADYFLESLNKASIFFESSTITADGHMLCDKMKAVVKIGHALHDYDPIFKLFTHSLRMNQLVKALGYKKPLIAQSRYFFKLPGVKGAIHPHQDSTVVYTEPLSCCAIWIALEDATVENGCMWIIPRSHHDGLLGRVLSDPAAVYGRRFLKLGNIPPWNDSLFVPLEVKAGTAVVMSGELIHQSKINKSNFSRQAYALHFIEGFSTHRYAKDNWLQRPGGFGELLNLQ
ncbi:phytanoyl-CoA dioxygenase family protein [Fluviispira multicolorata]|uniref:phytanoyl-CoA dioxygenase family protein n=1 Tax=Fluviispira multicolorata TaxID=2654512 RepID=UPI0013757F4A|nr:phytanoyl-CoA dioxygenase family protein [Fluviispira multicolorata]